jgi:hypothetical protein
MLGQDWLWRQVKLDSSIQEGANYNQARQGAAALSIRLRLAGATNFWRAKTAPVRLQVQGRSQQSLGDAKTQR